MADFLSYLTNTYKLGKVRKEFLDGREYLVASSTSIVPGILRGSKGALMYPHEEIRGHDVTGWDEVPLTMWHPTDNEGNHVSASELTPHQRKELGKIRNSKVGKGDKLQHEFWFDVENTQKYDRELDPIHQVLPRLKNGRPIEISTGLFTKNIERPGTFKGQQFDGVATNFKPDHIAVLPDQIGACSVNDGCGVNVNMAKLVINNGKNGTQRIVRNKSTSSAPVERDAEDDDLERNEESDSVANEEEFGLGVDQDAQAVPPLQGKKDANARLRGKATVTPEPQLEIGKKTLGKKGTPIGAGNTGKNNLSSSGAIVGNVWTAQARAAAVAAHHAMGAAHHFEEGQGDSSGAGGVDEHTHMNDAHQASKLATALSDHAYETAAVSGDPTAATGSAISTAYAYKQAALAHDIAAAAHETHGNHKAKSAHKKASDAHHSAAEHITKVGSAGMAGDSPGEKKKTPKKKTVRNTLTGNSISHDKIREKLHHKIKGKFTQDKSTPWIHEVHNDHVIYEHGGKLHKQGYKLNKKDEPDLKGKPQCVVQKTIYEIDKDNQADEGGHNPNPSMGAVFAGNVGMGLRGLHGLSDPTPSLILTDEVLNNMDREAVINHLCTNCSCWKGKQELLANEENFSDEDLMNLARNSSLAQVVTSKGVLVGNQRLRYDPKKNQFVLNKKAEGSNADVSDANTTPVAVGDEEEDDYEDQPYGAKQDVRAGMGIRTSKHKMAGKKKGTEGEEVTNAQWFENAPPDVQEVVRQGMVANNQRKEQLIAHILCNVSDPDMKARYMINLREKKIPELELWAQTVVPQQRQQSYNPFVDQQPVGNSFLQQLQQSVPQLGGQSFLGMGMGTQQGLSFNTGTQQVNNTNEVDGLEDMTLNFSEEKQEMDRLKQLAMAPRPRMSV